MRQGSQDFPGKMGVLLSPLHCLPEFITTVFWGLGLSAFHSWPPVNSGSQACPRFLQIWPKALPDHLARSHLLLLSMWCVLCPSFSCTDFGGKCRAFLNTPLSPSKPSLEPELWGGHPAMYVVRHTIRLCYKTNLFFLLLPVGKKLIINHHDLYITFINLSKGKSGLWKLFGKLDCPEKFKEQPSQLFHSWWHSLDPWLKHFLFSTF